MKTYDIFRRDASGPIWVDGRLYVENARARIQELAAHNPGKCFFVFDAQSSSVIFELTIGNNAEHPTHPRDTSSGETASAEWVRNSV
jgi:hypothetical protein